MISKYKYLIEFANNSFSQNNKADFLKIQPKVYNNLNKYYKNHYIHKNENNIIGMIAMYPVTWLGLKFISLGTICVDSLYRNQGIMHKMFNNINSTLNQYDLIYLNGDKNLYEKFGFYKAATYIKFRFKSNITKYNPFKKIDIELYDKNENHITNKLYDFYNKYSEGVSRFKETFYDTIKTNNTDIYVIEGIGYLLFNSNKKTILEIIADPKYIKDIICNFVVFFETNEIFYEVSKFNPNIKLLSDFCEDYSEHMLINIKVNNYVNIIKKLLAMKSNLLQGTVTIKILFKNTIKIEVNDKISIYETDSDIFDFSLTEKEMTTLLFNDYRLVLDENMPKNDLVKSWFSFNLPVTLHSIDGI